MLILGILMTILSVLLILLFTAYRRQVKAACRHMVFLQKNRTNLRLRSGLPFPELSDLADQVNIVLEQSEKLKREAAAGDRDLKEAITNISHDIRTPLTSLDGYFQLLSQAESEEERQQYISVIQSRIESLKDMLEELFTYTKLQNEAYTLQTKPVDFYSCVCNALLAFYNDFQEKGITPETDFCEGKIEMIGNTEAIRRIVQNILKNVLEHGSSKVFLRMKQEEGEVHFSCSNKLKHPEKVEIAQVFDRFYKADPARTHSSAGLGLAIAKGLAKRMNGRMEAELDGEWFRLHVYFPLVKR